MFNNQSQRKQSQHFNRFVRYNRNTQQPVRSRGARYSYGILLFNETQLQERLYVACQRARSIGFEECCNGHFELEQVHLLEKLANDMTVGERRLIVEAPSFDVVWHTIPHHWSTSLTADGADKKHFAMAKLKFELLRRGTLVNNCITQRCEFISWQVLFNRADTNYQSPCFEFPKGRRSKTERGQRWETNLECAQREFAEETGVGAEQYILERGLPVFYESFTGINGKRYVYGYYLARVRPENHITLTPQKQELSNVGWYTFDQLLRLLRLKDQSRRRLLINVHHFLSSCSLRHGDRPSAVQRSAPLPPFSPPSGVDVDRRGPIHPRHRLCQQAKAKVPCVQERQQPPPSKETESSNNKDKDNAAVGDPPSHPDVSSDAQV